ncbi:hypothetical protein [Atlantibacter hermannii]|uniref:hypothetical protein n=1 Tax=Atlantibacter hermannii TaxID=565 RepID=UPI001932E19E|nr:hypothetical protein [Atlantibacter hermannii]MBL7635929.1 hypothetical protein [Atlantibacter hermannii]MBL7674080.1 hypothetical protein [Atlantibacter hermannii]
METKHEATRIELTIENGVVTYVRQVQKGEITASLDTFFWIAKRAGYKVIPPDEPDEINVQTLELAEAE